jgi:hypothetical protein
VKTNKAGNLLLEIVDSALLEPPINLLKIGLHPKGFTPQIINYLEWRKHILEYLSRQIELTADSFLVELLAELTSYPHPEPTNWISSLPMNAEYDRFAVGLHLKSGAGMMSFFVTTTVFGTPIDVTLSELAIEVFFPADAQTAQILRQNLPTI